MSRQRPRLTNFKNASSSPMNKSLGYHFRTNDLTKSKHDKSSLANSDQKTINFIKSQIQEVIADIRQKKFQIEDMLVQQQIKLKHSQTTLGEMTTSFSKMKKIGRFMNIVCNLILGRNEETKNRNVQIFEFNSSSINPQYSLERQKIKCSLTPSNRRVRAFTFNEGKRKKENLTINIMESESDNHQLENPIKKFEVTSQYQQYIQNLELNKIQKHKNEVTKMQIGHKLGGQGNIERVGIDEEGNRKQRLKINREFSVKIKQGHKLLKKYKSMLKIVISCLHLCNDLVRKSDREKYESVESKMKEICQQFNRRYSGQTKQCDQNYLAKMTEQIKSCYLSLRQTYHKIST